ncbi:MAG: hypothetical protein WCT14_08190 [Treponemataceae bacterium]
MIPVRVSYRVPGLGTDARLVVFVLCAALGIVLQILAPMAAGFGTLIIAVPLILLTAKPWTNKPKDTGEEDWQPAGMAEVDRIADAFRSARTIKIPFWYRPASGLPLSILLGMSAFVSIPFDTRFSLVFFDALLLLWPTLHFLRIRIWIPRNLEMSMRCIQAALTVDLPATVSVTPYLRLDRDAEGLRIPEDIRLMVEPRRAPSDLVGIQLQAAINSGPSGAVPYLYAVVLTRGKGPSWRVAAAFRARGYSVEPGGDDEYGTVVIRQDTAAGGYHTDDVDCHRLMTLVLELVQAL